ncbi:hypothetical protein CRG98_035170, partial [Punica granatum]
MEVSRQGIVLVMAVALWIQIMSARSAVEATISRGSFPKGFVFGTASSAFQYEGAVNEDGRGLTVWDSFAHTFGIEPYVTLYHWDLPQALEDKYLGWLSPKIIKDFVTFAETCFEKFGDRVKHWITFNEPHTFAIQGYDVGLQAPGRCSILLRLFCRAGNSASEPYIVAHNVLLSHATAVDIYRKKLLDPLTFGDYPSSMKTRVGSRLPKFSQSESALVKGSLDFVGINHYTTYYAKANISNAIGVLFNDSLADSGAITLPFKDLKPIGDK